jgi:hypothetical protein
MKIEGAATADDDRKTNACSVWRGWVSVYCISDGVRTRTWLSCGGSIAFSGQSPEAIFNPVKVNAVKRVV